MDLRFEPLPDDPLRAPQSEESPPPLGLRRDPALPRGPGRQEIVRRQSVPASIAWSVLVHVVIFGILAVVCIHLPKPEPLEEPIPVTIRWEGAFSDLQGEEAAPGGMDTKTESPSPRQDTGAAGEGTGAGADVVDDDASFGVGGGHTGELWVGREGGKEAALFAGGGDAATEGAVHGALAWLARHQDADGTWNAKEFGARCEGPKCAGQGEHAYVEATTALTLLAYLGAGHAGRTGEWKQTVRKGADALVRMQRADGTWAVDGKRAYATALATLALSELHGMTGSKRARAAVERSVRFWVATQSPAGGWRYDPNETTPDSSVTGWVALALASARKAGIDVPEETVERAHEWFHKVTDEKGGVGYTSRGESTAALLGTGLFVDVILGGDAASPRNRATTKLLLRNLPRIAREGEPGPQWGPGDPTEWYYGSLAAFQAGGDAWKAWEPRLRGTLLPAQVREGDARGSWPPIAATGRHGGRVITTALCALSLEVYYRYPRASWR